MHKRNHSTIGRVIALLTLLALARRSRGREARY